MPSLAAALESVDDLLDGATPLTRVQALAGHGSAQPLFENIFVFENYPTTPGAGREGFTWPEESSRRKNGLDNVDIIILRHAVNAVRAHITYHRCKVASNFALHI